MKASKWHEELNRFLDIKTTFILEGNVYDLLTYPTKNQDGNIRWDMVMLDNYLYKYLVDNGYQRIIFYNHVDGFFNEYNPEMISDYASAQGLGNPDKISRTYKVTPERAADIIRTTLQEKSVPTTIILMMASRYVISAENISENERDFYTKLLCASLKKTQVPTENGLKNNLLFLVCDKVNDIPVWFYLDNSLEKTLTIQNPGKEARRMFIDTQMTFFLNGQEYEQSEIDEFKEHFIEMTDGFKNLELNALKILFRKEHFTIKQIKEAINLYKYGLGDNPWNDIPLDRLEQAEALIRKRVKGQDHAVMSALDVIKRAACNMAGLQHSSGTKPKGILFFAGPTGTGKTELAKTIAELLFGDENACIRFDMSEYQQGHSDQKLLGAPPGYVGYEAGGQLTNAVKEKPFSILLFDEIEKAHPSIFDKFLQILEDGRMTDGKGETVYFSECIIIFTSNLGIYDTDEYGKRVLNVSPDMSYDEMRSKIVKSIQDYFKLKLGRPEILNRIGDNFVVFDFIRQEVAKQILDGQLNKIVNNLMTTKGISLVVGDSAEQFLLNKAFGNLENGGRGVGNVVEKSFVNPLARYIFDNKVKTGQTITVTSITEVDGVSAMDCKVE